MVKTKTAGGEVKILISGACGVTSRSVVRSLRLSPIYRDATFIGMDVCDNLYGIYEGLYKKVYKIASCYDPKYRHEVETVIEKEKIELAIIIPEPEVLYWAEHPFDVQYLNLPPKFAKIALSKRKLYELLKSTNLVPEYQIISADKLSQDDIKLRFPLWIRDYSEGTTSGKGSYMPTDYSQLKAWLTINRNQKKYMISEVLPGRNYACFLLFHKGDLLKVGIAERMDYFMSKVAVSGITGNTAKGRLLNDDLVRKNSVEAVERVCGHTKEVMNGLVTVDLKENRKGIPMITEINLRHVAFTSSFANAGFNLAEYQLLCAQGKIDLMGNNLEQVYPKENLILRDIDGLPIYLNEHNPPEEIVV